MIGRRKDQPALTAFELQVMQALWDHGPSVVAEVQAVLKPTREVAYTTVQTVLNTLGA